MNLNKTSVSTASNSAANFFKLSASAMIAMSAFTFPVSAADISPVLGEQKTLVFLVNFQENPNEEPISIEDARNLVFGTVNDYYQANSYGQLSLSGDIAGLFTAPMSNQICDDATVADAVNSMAVDAGVPIEQYDRYIYLTTRTGCASEGSASTSGLPSRTSINGKFEPRVVAHELGHNFGLHHSSALDCDGQTIGSNCRVIEYGDSYDTMGNYDMGYFNIFQKERLGWMNTNSAPEVAQVENDGVFTIGPFEQNNGLPVAVKIPRGLDPATGKKRWFYIEYRQSLAHDSFLDSRSYSMFRGDVTEGVVVRLATAGDEKSSRLLHLKPNSAFKDIYGSNDWFDPAMTIGTSYTDPESGVSFSLLSANGEQAEISVQLAGTECRMENPDIIATPVAGQSALPGASLQYRVVVESRDSAECGSADYQVQADTESNWQSDSIIVNLSPGQSSETLITVSSASDSGAGTYTLPILAAQVANPSYRASDEVIFQVESQGEESNLQAKDDLIILSSKQAIIINVLANDLGLDPFTTNIVVSNPAKGSAEVLADGTIRYIPAKKFKNVDSFSYTISNGSSHSTAVVEIKLESTGGGNSGKGNNGKPN